jgi:hypothetical protein
MVDDGHWHERRVADFSIFQKRNVALTDGKISINWHSNYENNPNSFHILRRNIFDILHQHFAAFNFLGTF